MSVLYTTLSPKYCPDWGIREALRELFQEAIDVRTMYDCQSGVYYSHELKRGVIWDNGPGLPISALVMGNTTKRDNPDVIGQFGEGLKLACLVLSRMGRDIKIHTGDKTLAPGIMMHPDFGCEVLTFELYETASRQGTVVYVEVDEEEFNEVQSMFLQLTGTEHFYVPGPDGDRTMDMEEDRIFLPGGRIFIQGVEVQAPDSGVPLLFSYNIPAKSIQNRDRWAVDLNSMRAAIENLWLRCENYELIREYVQAIACGTECLEVSHGMVTTSIAYQDRVRDLWKQAVDEIIPNVVITTGDTGSLVEQLAPMGLRPLHVHYKVHWLLEELGVRTVEKVKELLDRIIELKPSALTPVQKFNYQQVKRLMKYVFPRGRELPIVPMKAEATELMGKYSGGRIYISTRALDDLPTALSTAIHEYAHHISTARDYTNGFQEALERIAVDLLLSRSTRRAS